MFATNSTLHKYSTVNTSIGWSYLVERGRVLGHLAQEFYLILEGGVMQQCHQEKGREETRWRVSGRILS